MALKKCAAFILLTCILISASACSGGADVGTDTSDGINTGAQTDLPETTAGREYTKPDIDLNGCEFIFTSYEQENPSWTARKYIEVYAEEQNGDIINDAIYTRALMTEETLGIKITPRPYKNINDILKPTLAGDHFADTVIVNGVELKSIQNSGLAQDLNSVSTLDLGKSWWDQNCVENLSIAHKLYGAAGDISNMGLLASHCVYMNKNIIEDFSLDNPYDMVRAGDWTLDQMEKLSKEVASDLNGDGVMDGSDLFGMSSEAIGMARMLASGIEITRKDDSDLPYLVLNSERAALAAERMVSLFRNKETTLYSNDFSANYSNVFREFIFQMFISDQLLFINNWLVWTLDLRVMESDFGILPPPKLDSEQENYVVGASEGWTTYAAIPITNTDLDETGYIMDTLGYYGKEYIYKALIETTITNKTLRDNDTEEMLEIIYSNRRYELASIYDWGGINGILSGFISKDNANFASAYAENEAKILNAIEETVKNIK